MYICNHCGEVFSTLLTMREIHTELEERPEETYTVCPYCHEAEYEPVYVCDKCGAYIPESQSKFQLCEVCEKKARERFTALLAKYFNPNERAYLAWVTEGEWF